MHPIAMGQHQICLQLRLRFGIQLGILEDIKFL
jgi:hypothetical protein